MITRAASSTLPPDGQTLMGVDVIAARTPGRHRDSDQFQDLTRDDLDAFGSAAIDMYQVAGPGTFWGWERWQLVREVCPGEISDPEWSDLGLEWVAPDKVHEIAVAFERCDASELLRTADLSDTIDVAVVDALRSFVRVCTDRGLGLIYWF